MLTKQLELFDLNHVMLVDGVLYERLYRHPSERVKGSPVHKYRKIIREDDYDYVTNKNLKAKLDRTFNKKEVLCDD